MLWMKTPARPAVIALLATTAVVAGACATAAGVGNKAGGPNQPVILRMADVTSDLGFTPGIALFAKRVSELSGGGMRIDIVYRVGGLAMDAEQQVVRDVAHGDFDLGFTGTSVFDTMGVTSFQTLTAPMLIDSYPLEDAVIRSGLPSRMMAGLGKLNVTGLAVLGGGLRRPIGVRHPILSPADWRGITFGTVRSRGQEAAIRALGATPGPGFATARDQAIRAGMLQGFDMTLIPYQMQLKEQEAPYITANVTLWPWTLALFANPQRLARLTGSQRAVLAKAAEEAAAQSTGLVRDESPVVRDICLTGGRFATASQADLTALRKRLAGVYAVLDANPQTRAFIQQIEALKRSTPAGPVLVPPAGCTGQAPRQRPAGTGIAPAYLNGTYRWTITRQDALASPTEDKSAEHLATFPWIFTATLNNGRWTLSHSGGEVQTDSSGDSYEVHGDRITFHWTGNGVFTYRYSVDGRGNLHLKPVLPMDPGEVFVWTTHPWVKIG
jgi:TRAP-type transport system periplasmic protein